QTTRSASPTESGSVTPGSTISDADRPISEFLPLRSFLNQPAAVLRRHSSNNPSSTEDDPIEDQKVQVFGHYIRATSIADEQGAPFISGLSLELAADYCISQGFTFLVASLLSGSIERYKKWGA